MEMSTTTATQARAAATSAQDWNLDAAHRLAPERINELLAEYQLTQNVELRNTVVQANMRLVAYIAARFRNKGLTRDELISEGAAALLRATATFDTTRGVSFATYASRAIEHSMRRALGCAHEIVTIPSAARRQRAKTRRAVEAFFIEHGERPISEGGGSTGGVLASVMLHSSPVSIHSSDAEGMFDPPAEPVDDVADADESRELVRNALKRLDPRRANIVRLRFGFDTGSPRGWEEVAQLAGVTTREAKSMAAEAMRTLKMHLTADQQAELAFPQSSSRLAGAA